MFYVKTNNYGGANFTFLIHSFAKWCFKPLIYDLNVFQAKITVWNQIQGVSLPHHIRSFVISLNYEFRDSLENLKRVNYLIIEMFFGRKY